MPLRGVDTRSGELAYVTKPNIAFPGTQAQADEAEVRARLIDTNQAEVNGSPKPGVAANSAGSSAATAASGTTSTIERNVLKAAT